MGDEQATIMDVVSTTDEPSSPELATFWASQLGYCRRQLYLSHLGLKDASDGRGRLNASRLIQDHLEEQVEEHCPHVDVAPKMAIDVDDLCFVGRPTAYDPRTSTVYHIKPRNGWYKFHPPNQRHLDQLQVYIEGTGASRGRLIYVSMGDLTDTRTWPPEDCEYVDINAERFQNVVAKARDVHDEIVANGVATTPREIPFERCGCFLCDQEELLLDSEALEGVTDTPSGREALPDGGDQRGTTETQPSSQRQLDDVETHPLVSDGYHVPADLKAEDIWVLWDYQYKIARAPWVDGNMYPVEWAEDSGTDPRHSFEKAKMVADLPVERIDESWPFPADGDLPETVAPAILLEHDPGDNPITLVDFDDVRDPESGRISQEAFDLYQELAGYAEISRSGTGLHVFVRGGLPDSLSTFSAPLEDVGHVEVYDHSRFVATTFDHVLGSPLDEVREAGDALAGLVERYSR